MYRCYFFENQECISKIYNLRIQKLLSNKILLTYFNLSEPIHKIQFNVRYPVSFLFLFQWYLQMDIKVSNWTAYLCLFMKWTNYVLGNLLNLLTLVVLHNKWFWRGPTWNSTTFLWINQLIYSEGFKSCSMVFIDFLWLALKIVRPLESDFSLIYV